MNAPPAARPPIGRSALRALGAAGCVWLAVWVPAAPAETSRPPLVVALDDNYPPYVFRDADGNLKSILPDQWTLWARKTGVPVDLRAMEWSKAQQFMREGKADVLDVTGEGGFAARLFIDQKSHLPLMLTWMVLWLDVPK